MGKINDMKNFFSGSDKEKEKNAEKAAKTAKTASKLKMVATNSLILGAMKLIASISIFVLVGAGVTALITAVLDTITARNTPERIYEAFELEEQDFSGLVEIKGDESSRILFTI